MDETTSPSEPSEQDAEQDKFVPLTSDEAWEEVEEWERESRANRYFYDYSEEDLLQGIHTGLRVGATDFLEGDIKQGLAELTVTLRQFQAFIHLRGQEKLIYDPDELEAPADEPES